jgi:hypothetical protein
MKIKINQKLKDKDGKEIVETPNPALTLRDVSVISILNPKQGDDEQVKAEKYSIWKKLRDSKTEVELTAEEITLLKKCIAYFQPQLIMGQCFEMIEGK